MPPVPATSLSTVRSLAKTLGLSRTTVSDALRGLPRVAAATVQKVRKAAREAGYRRNPLMAGLMAEMRQSRGALFRGVLAAVEIDEPEHPAHSAAFHRELTLGAGARAMELGFKVEKFSVGRANLSVSRLDSILQSRGIHGIMLLPTWSAPDLTKLDWTCYAGVYTDLIIERPALHTVCTDYYRSMMTVLTRLMAFGYRRPGLFLQKHLDERLQYRWSAAFRAFQETQPGIEPVPPLIFPALHRDEFMGWFERFQPDVVLSHFTDVIGWMESGGARVPATHGFASLNVLNRARSCAGLDLQPRELGACSVELLIAQLQRNECGIPQQPTMTAISARWLDGPTLRRHRGKTTRAPLEIVPDVK